MTPERPRKKKLTEKELQAITDVAMKEQQLLGKEMCKLVQKRVDNCGSQWLDTLTVSLERRK